MNPSITADRRLNPAPVICGSLCGSERPCVSNQSFSGERPLFGSRGMRFENIEVTDGESALKECADLEVVNSRFAGKYPLWHTHGFTVRDCLFKPGARAALWYSDHLVMSDCRVEAPKMFRDMHDLSLERVNLTDAQETLWHCRGVRLKDVEAVHGDYLAMYSTDIEAGNLKLDGNYAFQYCRHVRLKDCILNSKDAFWEAEEVVAENCEINGEYLAWHSRRAVFRNCRISGTQPLCYAHDLVLENCTFAPDADLAFEYSSVHATIKGDVVSVKNPLSGEIRAGHIGTIILDEHLREPGDCRIISER